MPEVGPLRTGDPSRLGGYELAGRLGMGAQGIVYLARADVTGEQYAIKLLHADLAEDAEVRSRFLREAQVARQVARFCTAQIVDVGLAHDRPFVVTEYVDGPSLRRLVSDEGPLGGAQLDRLAIGMATALVAIHRAGIVHRDFKPANVLIGPDGPRVIDFGVSRALDVTSTLSGGRAVGTPAYMSPEQLNGRDADPAMDVFAFGATLVYAATGAPPFGQDSIPAVMSRILTAEPDLGALSGPLRDVAAGCLVKDPARRPNAHEVLLRLLGHEAGVPAENAPGEALVMLAAEAEPAAEPAAGNNGVPSAPPEHTAANRAGSEPTGPSPAVPPRPRAVRRAAIAAGAALATAGCVVGAFWLALTTGGDGSQAGGDTLTPPGSVLSSVSGSATPTKPTRATKAKAAGTEGPVTRRRAPDEPTRRPTDTSPTVSVPVEAGLLWTERGGVTISKDEPSYPVHVWTEGGPVNWTTTTSGPISAPAKGFLPADGRTDITITKNAGAPDQGCGTLTITGEKNSRQFTLCWE